MLSIRCLFVTFVLCQTLVVAGEEKTFSWKESTEAGELDLMFGDDPVLRYMFAYDTSSSQRQHETYKVYHHVFGPGTETRITKGPGGQYTHHRGMFIGWNKTTADGKTYDFWHCKNGAHLRHIRFLKREANADFALMTAEIHWNDPLGKPVIREERTVKVTPKPIDSKPGYAYQIDWSTRLESQRGPINLSGDRQHAGFQFRAAQKVAEEKSGTYLRHPEAPQEAKPIQVGDKGNPPAHINLGWFALTYPLGEEHFTVAYFDSPNLPKPSLFSERPYGRFGTFFKTSLTEAKPLEMRYRVLVFRGQPQAKQIHRAYEKYLSEL